MSLSPSRLIGVRLERKKEASLINWNLKRPYPPGTIRVPVPPDSKICVQSGEEIQLGQKIAEPESRDGVSVHTGMPGLVESIGVFPDALGRETLGVVICRQGEPKPAPPPEMRRGWEQIPDGELPGIFQRSGLVTTDSRMEAVHVKLRRHAGTKTVLINGCEPEPYITCEQVLAQSHPVEILKGAELLRKACGALRIIFAFENSNLETIELIKSKLYLLKWEHAEVRAVPAVYPQGLESTLLQNWFSGKEHEATVFAASTAFAVYEAVALQKTFYERVVTVGGECVVEPRSLWLPLGISFQDAIHACKGTMREPRKLLMGGPMAGAAQKTADVPVMAGTNAILALPGEIAGDRTEEPCIRCNRCVSVCPVRLSPVMITLAAEQKEFAIAEEWGARDCVECGNCAYVCPSHRPTLGLIRSATARGKAAVTP